MQHEHMTEKKTEIQRLQLNISCHKNAAYKFIDARMLCDEVREEVESTNEHLNNASTICQSGN